MNEILNDIIVRLADEEIPVGAIARAMRFPIGYIYETLEDAKLDGRIIRVPQADWHPLGKGQKAPASTRWAEDELVFSCMRVFKITRLQASFLAVLIRRNQASRLTLHEINKRLSANKDRETDIKIVDVIIHHLRVRLKPFNILVKTLWSSGYYMEPDQRKRVHEMLSEHENGGAAKEVEATPSGKAAGRPEDNSVGACPDPALQGAALPHRRRKAVDHVLAGGCTGGSA